MIERKHYDMNCSICDKSFDGIRNFKIHMRKHDEKLKCHICDKQLSCAKTLNEHKVCHEKKGDFLQ